MSFICLVNPSSTLRASIEALFALIETDKEANDAFCDAIEEVSEATAFCSCPYNPITLVI